MYIFYEPNPCRSGAIDCSVRAISKALDITWEKAFVMLSVNGFLMGNVLCADEVWGSLLRQHGFKRHLVPDTCPDCYSVKDFCEEHPTGVHVVKSENHVACVVDGNLYDSWNSEDKTVILYWEKEN